MLANRRLIAACVVALCCNTALLVVFIKYQVGPKHFVTIDANQHVITHLPNNFLSIGIDTSQIEDYSKINFLNPRLRQLAAELSPARLRLGGDMSERLIFSRDDISNFTCINCHSHSKSVCHAVTNVCKKFLPFFVMTGSEWTIINEFCKATKLQLMFSLNALIRTGPNNTWSHQNAADLIQYSKEKEYDLDWQLGNEPNSFLHKFNISVSPHDLAHDFKRLRLLLNEKGYETSLLVGPDTTRPQKQRPECLKYMVDFLSKASHTISVRSWHQYYLNSRTATLEDFWNPDTFDLLEEQILTMINHTRKYVHIPMWLTETSSSYGGGAEGLSNSYAASPLWLDKLGLSAKYNITTVVRQSFIGGNYCLVDKDMEPLPDWWVSLLYKKLVGGKVLHVPKINETRFQRLYAHCTNRDYTNDTTAVTLYGVNLEMSKAIFILNGTALHGDNLSIDEYILRAPSNNRRSKIVLLNGWPLYYKSSLPAIQPVHLRYGKTIAMPPFSIGFWGYRKGHRVPESAATPKLAGVKLQGTASKFYHQLLGFQSTRFKIRIKYSQEASNVRKIQYFQFP